MHASRPLLIALTFLALVACQTSSLTEKERAPVPEPSTPFSGAVREVDEDRSAISFVGRSNVVDHEGKFTDYTVTVTPDPSDPGNLERMEIRAEIFVGSVLVDAPGLQAHLLREEFFDADRYPKASFQSSGIARTGETAYEVSGILTIKGHAKSVTLPATITDRALAMHYDLPREEFGIGNDSYGNKILEPLVPVDVKIVFK